MLSALSVLALLMALLSWRRRGWSAGAGFLPVFALAVTYSVALAGLYVVFATLIITPWVQGRLQGRGPALAMAAALAGHAGGLGLSVLADVPAGPAVVVTTLVAALAMWFPARRRA